uniref:hypothetical protein n=1 Tax=Enterocloster clostridioformis TaxID=1531 RepID=UPI0026EE81EF
PLMNEGLGELRCRRHFLVSWNAGPMKQKCSPGIAALKKACCRRTIPGAGFYLVTKKRRSHERAVRENQRRGVKAD